MSAARNQPHAARVLGQWVDAWDVAQAAAGLGHIDRLGWHSLRRQLANDLRHVPLKNLASLGGWKDTQTLLKCLSGGG